MKTYLVIILAFRTLFLDVLCAFFERFSQVPLVPPNRLSEDGTYLISITIRHKKMDTSHPDSDLILMISDNASCTGFWFMDQQPFVTVAGKPGVVLTKMSRSVSGVRVDPTSEPSSYPELWQMRMRLTKQSTWGNVWAASKEGKGHQSTYPHVLKPHNGLWLELYRDDPQESYQIKYIEVTISAEH